MKNKDFIKLMIYAGELKDIYRSGWLQFGVERPETVAAHTYRCALMASILAKKLGLDTEKLMKMALIHDLGEAEIGDWIQSGLESDVELNKKSEAEHLAIERILQKFPAFLDLYNEFEAQKTQEAIVMRLIDKLDLVLQAGTYEKQQRNLNSLNEFWESAGKFLMGSDVEGLFLEIKEYFK